LALHVSAQDGSAAAPLDSIAERTRACTACHGKEGRATADGYFPRIAGKPQGYLFNQLVNFRDGRRQNAAMIYMVQHTTDAYLQEIAGYFSSSILEIAGEQIEGMSGVVRVVCNSELDADDVQSARAANAAIDRNMNERVR
jgi:cytochrome c553